MKLNLWTYLKYFVSLIETVHQTKGRRFKSNKIYGPLFKKEFLQKLPLAEFQLL